MAMMSPQNDMEIFSCQKEQDVVLAVTGNHKFFRTWMLGFHLLRCKSCQQRRASSENLHRKLSGIRAPEPTFRRLSPAWTLGWALFAGLLATAVAINAPAIAESYNETFGHKCDPADEGSKKEIKRATNRSKKGLPPLKGIGHSAD